MTKLLSPDDFSSNFSPTAIPHSAESQEAVRNLNSDAKAAVHFSGAPSLAGEERKRYLTGLQWLKRIPSHLLWMLAVDGKFFSKEKGPIGFENREPGSIAGISKGLLTSIRSSGPLTVQQLQDIHQACMEGVETKYTVQFPFIPGEYRQTTVGFEVMPGWSSPEGLKDLATNYRKAKLFQSELTNSTGQILVRPDAKPLDEKSSISNIHGLVALGAARLVYLPPSPTEIKIAKEMQAIVERYNANMSQLHRGPQPPNLDDFLQILARTTQELVRLHPFRDGNNRTAVNGFLNSRLIQHGLPPAIFLEPNLFEFHTVTQLVPIIKEAMKQTQRLIKDPNAEIYGFKNSSLQLSLAKDRNTMRTIQAECQKLATEVHEELLAQQSGMLSNTRLFVNSGEKLVTQLLQETKAHGPTAPGS